MADVALVPQKANPNSITPTYTGSLSISDVYTVKNNGRTLLHFKKTGAGNCTVTVQTPRSLGGLAVAEQTFTVPATTGDVMAGPFQPSIYNDSSQELRVTLSEITGLSVAAIDI